MKKVFIILLMLVYGLSSSGMTISLHYCCGKLDGISFSGKQGKSCDMGNHLKKSGCCDDKQISATITGEQQTASKWVQVNKQSVSIPNFPAVNSLFTDYIISVDRLGPRVTVPISPVPLFIKNCVFRI
jgi:hypothetical protein